MELTSEQQAVVDIDSGRHLVLAPPGSGKTEMLTQRVVSALRNGVDPKKMFCVTFTVRAGVEMRERVASAVASEAGLRARVPDIGNIHHFCNRVLLENNLITEGQRVVDDIAQKELIRDVWIQLKKELKQRIRHPPVQATTQLELDFEEREVADVLRVLDYFQPSIPVGTSPDAYYSSLLGIMERCEEEYEKQRRSVYPDLVMASAIIHQQTVGIPHSLLLPIPLDLYELRGEGLLSAISKAYVHLKDRFGAIDFDDLITNTYLALKEDRILPTSNRYQWIQVDEVQDLNALQWAIVKMVSREDATVVYFGDMEQTIFSFMGASLERLSRVAANCDIHYFKKNFRATDYLLDILVRFSIRVLRSQWIFLPEPCGNDFKKGELFCGEKGQYEAVQMGLNWIDQGKGKNVALLVRKNKDADEIERIVKGKNVKYVKVSGVEIFERNAMRDFMALCTLLADGGDGPLMVWARIFRRFGGITRDYISRRLVKKLIDSGVAPRDFLEANGRSLSPWTQQRFRNIHENFSTLWQYCSDCLIRKASYREIFNRFEDECWSKGLFAILDYVTPDELDQYFEQNGRRMSLDEARGLFLSHSKKLFDYLDKRYEVACGLDNEYENKTFGERLKIEWPSILQLKEADLMTGDEQIIISTIHKAKGRQFDGVIIPRCQEYNYPSFFANTDDKVDEEARVLYVGLSRAKCNLAVCWDEYRTQSRFLESIAPCFRQDFRNFFRPDRDPHDWLVEYNKFLEDGLQHTCNQERVANALSGTDKILMRVAVSTVQYASDSEAEWRDGIYGRFLDQSFVTPEDCDLLKEALKGIATLQLSSFVENRVIRKAFSRSTVSPHKDKIRFAILDCYGSFLRCPDLSEDDILDGNIPPPMPDNIRDRIKAGIEDALFDSTGDVRLEAVRLLKEHFDANAYDGFDGSDRDWIVLRNHVTPQRHAIITWILKKYGEYMTDKTWNKNLRDLCRRGG